MLRCTGIQSYSCTEQRKVEKDVDRITGIELATFQLRRPRTNRLSYVCINRGVPRFSKFSDAEISLVTKILVSVGVLVSCEHQHRWCHYGEILKYQGKGFGHCSPVQ